MMTDAFNAKGDVLGERELDAVSGGSISIAGLVGLVDFFIQAAGGGTSGGGQNDRIQQVFQQVLQQH
jgi:hypothetical protein